MDTWILHIIIYILYTSNSTAYSKYLFINNLLFSQMNKGN